MIQIPLSEDQRPLETHQPSGQKQQSAFPGMSSDDSLLLQRLSSVELPKRTQLEDELREVMRRAGVSRPKASRFSRLWLALRDVPMNVLVHSRGFLSLKAVGIGNRNVVKDGEGKPPNV